MTGIGTHPRPLRAASLIVLASILPLAACSDDDDQPQVVNLTDETIGTCLEFGTEVEPEISELPITDCETAHSHEIIAIVLSGAETYPGFEALETEAQAKCLAEFEPYVGINPFDSTLFTSWLVPTLDSWDREDDRQIICVVGNENAAPLVGTVEQSRR